MTDLAARLEGLDAKELDQLKVLLENRRKEVMLEALKGLGLGSAVVFTHSVRPKYLAGITGTVAGFAGKDKISVKVDELWLHDNRIRRFGPTITTPLSLVALV